MKRRLALLALLLAVQVGAANLSLASTSTSTVAAVQATTYVVFDQDPKTLPSLATASIEFRDQVVSPQGRGAEVLIVVHGVDKGGNAVTAIRERLPLTPGSYAHDAGSVTVRSTWRGAPLNLTFTATPETATPMNATASVGYGYYTAIAGRIAQRSVLGTVDMLGYRGCGADPNSLYKRGLSGAGTTPAMVDLTASAQWSKPKRCKR